MKLFIQHGLPFVTLTIRHEGNIITIDHVLVDTGSASTLFSTDLLATVGIKPDYRDSFRRVNGVGGYEYVVEKVVDELDLGGIVMTDHPIQLGEMDYGFNIKGIIGSDIFIRRMACIDFSTNSLKF